MEKNIKGEIKISNNGLDPDSWYRKYISDKVLRGEKQITTTFGKRK
jgi:hypothetical protein